MAAKRVRVTQPSSRCWRQRPARRRRHHARSPSRCVAGSQGRGPLRAAVASASCCTRCASGTFNAVSVARPITRSAARPWRCRATVGFAALHRRRDGQMAERAVYRQRAVACQRGVLAEPRPKVGRRVRLPVLRPAARVQRPVSPGARDRQRPPRPTSAGRHVRSHSGGRSRRAAKPSPQAQAVVLGSQNAHRFSFLKRPSAGRPRRPSKPI